MDNIYCYPASDVLINRLNIHDSEKLREVERKLTSLRIEDLLEFPIQGSFDFNHLKEIHEYIFQDLYEWAGKIRSVDIAKGNMFCKFQFIEEQAKELFDRLKKDNYLKNLNFECFVKKLAYYFSEINALHPFREGNGRTQREFIRQLSKFNGYKLKFDKISEQEMMEASIDSFLCKYDKMERILMKCIK